MSDLNEWFNREFDWRDGDEWLGIGHSGVNGSEWRIVKDKAAMMEALAKLLADCTATVITEHIAKSFKPRAA